MTPAGTRGGEGGWQDARERAPQAALHPAAGPSVKIEGAWPRSRLQRSDSDVETPAYQQSCWKRLEAGEAAQKAEYG